MKSIYYCALFLSIAFFGCKSGPFNIIKPASPHEQYRNKLTNAGFHQTAMGATWLSRATESLQKPLFIQLPYQEKGYFAADQPDAITFRFKLTRGEKITVKLSKEPSSGFQIYMDIWELQTNNNTTLLASADTLGNAIQLDAKQTGDYLIRLQPELLGSGAYTLSLTKGPSLAFPLKAANRKQIQSLYGVGRDNNTRKHEGVDIFAPFRTPVLATAPGRVTSVNSNNLGGKVVWFRPEGKDYTLYYAHLDEQTVSEGQVVNTGDTLGRMGNTGNAASTSPHLHFGIYTNNGAIDPLPFIDPTAIVLPSVVSSSTALHTTMRTVKKVAMGDENLNLNSIVQVNAATADQYRVKLPNGERGFLSAKALTSTSKQLSTYPVKNSLDMYDQPSSVATVKLQLKVGQNVSVLGVFGNYQLIVVNEKQTGWIKK